MADFLSAYSIQNWLESCPQGYLMDTVYGHAPDMKEPEELLANPVIREDAIRTNVQLVLGERCALAASSGLINAAPDEASKRFLATQTLDEARHVEIFSERLYALGVARKDLESVINDYANPHLVRFAEVLLEKVDKKDFVAGVVGQNIILEGMAFTVFEMMHTMSKTMNPIFAQVLSGTIADERRHVGFGENRIGALIRQYPEKKPEVERMQKEMSYHMLATFALAFKHNAAALAANREIDKRDDIQWHGGNLARMSAEEMEQILGTTVLKEFRTRLDRIGIEYQTPVAA